MKRGRRRPSISAHSTPQGDSQVRVCAASTKQFDAAVRKNPILSLRNELDRLCRTLPPEALSALGDALRETVKGFVEPGTDTLEGLGGPSAHIRIAVQTRRNRGNLRSSRSRLAQPYIWRLMILSRLICPSTCPLLQARVTAARTAS